MRDSPNTLERSAPINPWLPAMGLLLILVLGAYLRFEGLGLRSLWRDELCTWHVSRMNLGESIRWGPELTKPPLYQIILRAISSQAHLSEWTLRFPAALCGVLTILAGYFFGKMCAGWRVGLALAGLLACNALQIEYSQEGRPYTILTLGCLVSTMLWYRLARRAGWFSVAGYVVITTLTLYANYLTVFTIAAQGLWWLTIAWRNRSTKSAQHQPESRAQATGANATTPPNATVALTLRPLLSMVAVGVLCLPQVVRYLTYKTSMFQGLEWIDPPTLGRAFRVLGRLTFDWQWMVGLLTPALVLWVLAALGYLPKRRQGRKSSVFAGREDSCGLLLVWLACAWFGLLVVSWIAHPAMVARYALPASVPAILFPLIVADRLHPRAPLLIALVFMAAAIPGLLGREVQPGLREMAAYLQETVDPEREMVVLTIDNTIYPGWHDSERLGFRYYPLENVPQAELQLDPDGVTAKNSTLEDPRGFYMVVLWANPFPILEAAGREPVPIFYEGSSYSQLLFTPYRLVRVAPITPKSE